jgi:hypothetical protein
MSDGEGRILDVEEATINGEKIRKVLEVIRPSDSCPYWTIITEESTIFATGSISIKAKRPDAKAID